MILGTINFIEGLAAIDNAHLFTTNAHYIAGDLKTWGWVVLIIGVTRSLSRSARPGGLCLTRSG